MKKILWLDTETTGTDATLHSIIQIAGIIDIDGVEKLRFDYKCKPHPDFEIDDEALLIHKFSRKIMSGFPEIRDTYNQIKQDFRAFVDPFNREDKFIIAGQNIRFDLDMLSHFFMRQNDNYLGSFIDFKSRIELMDITKGLQALGFIKSDNIRLSTLCKEFGITLNAHNALSDILATRELYYSLLNRISFNPPRSIIPTINESRKKVGLKDL